MPCLSAPRRSGPTVALVLVVAALAFPLGALANHQFSDVPTSASYHDDVDKLVDAGITDGCGGGKYCPLSPVTRAQMAQFLTRGLGSVAHSNTELATTVVAADLIQDVAAVTIDVPSVGGTQFVHVQGEVAVYGADVECPCQFSSSVSETSETAGPNPQLDQMTIAGYNQRSFAASHVFSAAPGTHTYFFNLNTDSGSTWTVTNVSLTATTYPFSSGGPAESAIVGPGDE